MSTLSDDAGNHGLRLSGPEAPPGPKTEAASASANEAAKQERERLQVERAKAGDPATWAAWYDAYYSYLYRYAYYRLRRRQEAEDAVADAFLEAFRGIGRFEYTGRPVLAWLYRITHNIVDDRLARGRLQLGSGAPAAEGRDPGPEAALDNIDMVRALESLTEEQQQVIVLRYLLGMPANEVAELMGKRPAAIFSLQARALATMRRALEGRRRP
jgi:RNA polymerase sigma-70 factor (ECF subfamily)